MKYLKDSWQGLMTLLIVIMLVKTMQDVSPEVFRLITSLFIVLVVIIGTAVYNYRR